ncbi:hypothetical protein C8R47DRAFT_1108010 [Mycena vitilis]|nr:hypothetical protein C8R47DRAFT_1108010 [Mycena vitilis]
MSSLRFRVILVLRSCRRLSCRPSVVTAFLASARQWSSENATRSKIVIPTRPRGGIRFSLAHEMTSFLSSPGAIPSFSNEQSERRL